MRHLGSAQFGFAIACGGNGSNDNQCPVSARCSCNLRHVFQRLDVSLIRALFVLGQLLDPGGEFLCRRSRIGQSLFCSERGFLTPASSYMMKWSRRGNVKRFITVRFAVF